MAKHTFILSDESVNSYGFRVLTTGINTERFEQNPVMLYEHNTGQLIGRWENIRKEDGKLKADAVFDEEDELAQKVSKRVEKGFLKGASIGFNINKAVGDTVTESLLMEASIVTLPGNGNALRLYADGRLLTDAEVKEFALNLKTQITNQNSQITNKMKLNATNLTALGINEDATEEQLNSAVAMAMEENKRLKAELDKINSEKIEAMLDEAITAGKLKAEQKGQFAKLAAADLEAVKSVIAGLSAAVKPADVIKPGEQTEKKTFAELRKNPAELAKLKAEQPEEYAKLLKESGIARHI
jgi:HK97 family phage prohead protease